MFGGEALLELLDHLSHFAFRFAAAALALDATGIALLAFPLIERIRVCVCVCVCICACVFEERCLRAAVCGCFFCRADAAADAFLAPDGAGLAAFVADVVVHDSKPLLRHREHDLHDAILDRALNVPLVFVVAANATTYVAGSVADDGAAAACASRELVGIGAIFPVSSALSATPEGGASSAVASCASGCDAPMLFDEHRAGCSGAETEVVMICVPGGVTCKSSLQPLQPAISPLVNCRQFGLRWASGHIVVYRAGR